MAKLKYKDDLERGALFPSGAVGMNTVKENGLDVVAVPEEYWHGAPPAGYSRVTNGQQAQNPGYVEQNRGNWDIADNAFMTDDDWNAVQRFKQQYDTAKAAGDQAGMDAAHAAAENIRLNNYGYSGGADGNAYNQAMAYTGNQAGTGGNGNGSGIGRGSGSGGFGYGTAPSYLSKYQERIDALADAILNRKAFSYDKNSDPLYQQYEESYTRGGKRGMQDTLAQVSARTGGLASSYATGAAQQTYNNYMAELANKVPELWQLARSMYLEDLAQDREDLGMLMGLEENAYGMFQDELSQWNADRDFDYGAYRDGVSDSQWQQQFDYQKAQDALAQQNYEKEFGYQQEQDALAQQNWQTQWDYQLQQDALDRQKVTSGGRDLTSDEEVEETYIDNTEGLEWLREMERDGASVEELHDMLTQLYRNGLISEEAYNRRLDRYRVN